MGLSLRLAVLALAAALVAPALAVMPRSTHGFILGPAMTASVLGLAAWILSLRGQTGPLPRLSKAWFWLGLVYALGWALWFSAEHWYQLQPAAWVKRWPMPVLAETWLRVGLLSGALGLLALAVQAQAGALPRWVLRLALVWMAWQLASGALSGRPDLAAWALADHAAYPLCFAAAWRLSAQPSMARKLAAFMLLAGVLNALYALLQRLGLDPMPWNQDFGGRAMGFSGNPNYLGGFLALLLPLSLGLALNTGGKSLARAVAWMVVALLGAALLLTETRGAWVGGALGSGLTLWLVAKVQPGLLGRHRLALALVAALGVAGLSLALAKPDTRQRMISALSFRDEEMSRRFFLMGGALRLAKAHPVFGVGPGAFGIHFPSLESANIPPQDLALQPFVVSSHAHNDVLHMAAETGWLTALAWMVLVGWLLARLVSACGAPAQRKDLLLLAGASGGLVALTLHGLANFPFLMPATQAPAWALAALALRSLGAAAEPLAQPRLGKAGLVWGLLFLALLAFLNGRRLQKDLFWYVGEGELNMKREEVASNILLRALSLDRRDDQLWKLHGRAEREKEMVWNSIGSLREAQRLNPFDAEAGVRLGRALLENKQWEEAEAVLRRTAGYAPNFVDVWEPLAAACFQSQKWEEAVKAYDWMVYYKVSVENAYANKAAAQGMAGKHLDALATLRNAEMEFPENGKIQLNIAITYLKLGDKMRAREAWKKAERLRPSDPQVDQLREIVR